MPTKPAICPTCGLATFSEIVDGRCASCRGEHRDELLKDELRRRKAALKDGA